EGLRRSLDDHTSGGAEILRERRRAEGEQQHSQARQALAGEAQISPAERHTLTQRRYRRTNPEGRCASGLVCEASITPRRSRGGPGFTMLKIGPGAAVSGRCEIARQQPVIYPAKGFDFVDRD